MTDPYFLANAIAKFAKRLDWWLAATALRLTIRGHFTAGSTFTWIRERLND